MPTDMSAARFVERLEAYRSSDELKNIEPSLKTDDAQSDEGDPLTGVGMGQIFTLAKEFIDMKPIVVPLEVAVVGANTTHPERDS